MWLLKYTQILEGDYQPLGLIPNIVRKIEILLPFDKLGDYIIKNGIKKFKAEYFEIGKLKE